MKKLNYPITHLEDYSQNEKSKLFQAVIFYVNEKPSLFYRFILFMKKLLSRTKS